MLNFAFKDTGLCRYEGVPEFGSWKASTRNTSILCQTYVGGDHKDTDSKILLYGNMIGVFSTRYLATSGSLGSEEAEMLAQYHDRSSICGSRKSH